MLIKRLKSKIHRAVVTEANLNYLGSISIDSKLMEAAGILAGELVQIVNINNGERLETYAIEGEPGSGIIGLNGAAARKVCAGDLVIIMAYAYMEPDEAKNFRPTKIFPDEHNQID
jgi:aspartate 1-decarboxylase